jgi:predicted unusual protein kinase regulating ubiquinone biosynthesis (AarF/ABC1/UbiB family)
VTLRARWVTLRARWVTLTDRWVTLRARWVTLRARSGVSQELNYVQEGLNAERFASLYGDRLEVFVPGIHWEESSTRVLTMEWVEGIKLSDQVRVSVWLTNGAHAGRRVCRTYPQALFLPHSSVVSWLAPARVRGLWFGCGTPGTQRPPLTALFSAAAQAAIARQGLDIIKLVDIGINCSLRQLLEHGFFHADPHPGNLLATPDGRLAFLDFGMMSETPPLARYYSDEKSRIVISGFGTARQKTTENSP